MMGDMSREPSMEDILSSIRRVIARDETPGTVRAPRPAVDVDVLDLHHEEAEEDIAEPQNSESTAKEPEATTVEPETETVEVETRVEAETKIEEELVSPASADAARQSLDALSAAVAPPPAPSETHTTATSGRTLEAVVVDTLRPMLKEWLDANLPPLVEAMVAKEISRIARRP